jgi:restriction system protein
MNKVMSRSNKLASRLMYCALSSLRDMGGSGRGADVLDLLPSKIDLDSWAQEIIESNGLTRWRTFAHFFSVDAVKAGYLLKAKGVWTITPEGVEALKLGEEGYFYAAQSAYRKWRKNQLVNAGGAEIEPASVKLEEALPEMVPPEVQFDSLKQELHSNLAAEILERIKGNSWQFFEQLVIHVLVAMGYGGADGKSQAFRRGGDGGIDGFINQDRLGLDVFYVQAKRWTDQSVGRPDIQQFVGALAGRQASRGIFITSSRFTAEAKEFVKNLNVKVILIDGEHLAQLMIEYGVGVSVWKSFELKRIDSDFFVDE